MINRNYLAAAIAAVAVQAAMPAAAQDDDKCCFRLTPYYWAVGIDGELKYDDGIIDQEVNFNRDIGDVTEDLEFNGSLMLEANFGHWANYAAIDYIKTENDDTDLQARGPQVNPLASGGKVELEAETTLATVATGYRWNTGERSWVDLLIGARYAKLDLEANVKGGPGSVDADDDLVDGIIMMRPRIALGKYWAFNPIWSVGAGDSDLVWEVGPEFVYVNDCCNLEFRFGYRSVNYELEEGDAELDFSYSGPMIGLGFAF